MQWVSDGLPPLSPAAKKEGKRSQSSPLAPDNGDSFCPDPLPLGRKKYKTSPGFTAFAIGPDEEKRDENDSRKTREITNAIPH